MPRTAYYRRERAKRGEVARLKVIKRGLMLCVHAKQRSSVLGHSDVKGHCEIAVALKGSDGERANGFSLSAPTRGDWVGGGPV